MSCNPRRLVLEPWEIRRQFRPACLALFCRRESRRQNRAFFKECVGVPLVPRAHARGYMTSPLAGSCKTSAPALAYADLRSVGKHGQETVPPRVLNMSWT